MKKKISNKLFDISPPPKIYKHLTYQPNVFCKPLPAQFETQQHQKSPFAIDLLKEKKSG